MEGLLKNFEFLVVISVSISILSVLIYPSETEATESRMDSMMTLT